MRLVLLLVSVVSSSALASDGDSSEVATRGEPAPLERPAVVTGVGVRGFGRVFAWAPGASASLPAYTMPYGSAVAFEAAWYPGAHVTQGAGANFGVFLDGAVGLGLTSHTETATFGTSAQRLRFGARLRFPLGEKSQLDVLLGYGTQTFDIAARSPTGTARPDIPSVSYAGPRGALGATFRFSERVGGDLLAGFTWLLGTGEIGSPAFFPNASGLAADASLGLSIKLVDALRLRLSADWTGYFLSMNAGATSTLQATTAMDQFVGGTLALAWAM